MYQPISKEESLRKAAPILIPEIIHLSWHVFFLAKSNKEKTDKAFTQMYCFAALKLGYIPNDYVFQDVLDKCQHFARYELIDEQDDGI